MPFRLDVVPGAAKGLAFSRCGIGPALILLQKTPRRKEPGNQNKGIYITGSADDNDKYIQGNKIGPNKNNAAITGASQQYGIYIDNSESSWIYIGPFDGPGWTDSYDTITYNTIDGIYINGTSAHNVWIGCSSI